MVTPIWDLKKLLAQGRKKLDSTAKKASYKKKKKKKIRVVGQKNMELQSGTGIVVFINLRQLLYHSKNNG